MSTDGREPDDEAGAEFLNGFVDRLILGGGRVDMGRRRSETHPVAPP